MVDILTIVLMLLAGLLQASWHSLVKYGANQIVVLVGMGNVAAVGALCALPFLPAPTASVWVVIAVSVALHNAYKFALARSYSLGDLGQAYPLARGFVPLCSAAIAFGALGQALSAAEILGIAIVSAGLIGIAVHSVRGGVDRRIFLTAFAAGLMVAGYTVLDAYGTRLQQDWASFTAWLVVADSLSFTALGHVMRGRQLWRDVWTHRLRMLVAGILGLVSFSVFIWALSRSAVGPVSALRESSVLFATIIGMAVHREAKSAVKFGAAALIVIGLVVVAAAR
jgi:drug/metabolite transporter (DMT)-like permease